MTQRVLLSMEGHVAHVVLNRPEKRNGLDLAMFEALLSVAEELRKQRGVRAVVLRGEGKAFSAGLDWAAFLREPPEVRERLFSRDGVANRAQQICWQWQELDVPVIAVVQGATFGAGLELALGADIRLAAPDAQLSIMEVRYGLVPDMAPTRTLRAIVREDVLRELVFTARIVAAEEAARLGLVTRVEADPLAAARQLAEEICGRSPDAVRAAKRLFRDSLLLAPRESFVFESEVQRTVLGGPNQIEAVMAVMEKRAPNFTD
jgi:enoyl-CoA hydratase/carnithine racemase